jgi:hypothetical protein
MAKICTNKKLPEKLRKPKEIYGDFAKIINGQKMWKCPECWGNGKLFDTDDHDPIEGYKLAHRKIPCTTCQATGYVSREFILCEYAKIKHEYELKLEDYYEWLNLIASAENKLTNDEIDAINNANPYFGY